MPISARKLNYEISDVRPPWRTDGLPVVFHHGIGTSLGIWADWVPTIASRHKALRFDLRGYGASAVPPESHKFTMSELIEDLIDTTTLTRSDKVHLVGESLGGTVCLATALAHPERVASVTVTNTAHRGAGINRVMHWRDEFKRLGVKGWSDQMMGHRFVEGALEADKRKWFASEQETMRDYITIGYGEMLAAADLTPELPGLKAPLLIIMPDASPFVPVRMGAEMKELVPHAELCVFPGVRHGLPFSHAKQCAELALRHMERAESGAKL